MKKRKCTLYLRRGVVYIRSVSSVHRGPYQDDGPCGRIPDPENFEKLGAAAVHFAGESREDIENKPNQSLNEATRVWLDAAGVSSWSTFVRLAKNISFRIRDEIEIMPYHNGGLKGSGRGYTELQDRAIHLPLNASHEKIGRAIMEAFKRCS